MVQKDPCSQKVGERDGRQGDPEGGWSVSAGEAVRTVGTGGEGRRSLTPVRRQAGDRETGCRSDRTGFPSTCLLLLSLRFLSVRWGNNSTCLPEPAPKSDEMVEGAAAVSR